MTKPFSYGILKVQKGGSQMYYSTRLKERMRKTPFSAYWEKKFAEDKERERKRQQEQMQMYSWQRRTV